jgi:hypothetical protein
VAIVCARRHPLSARGAVKGHIIANNKKPMAERELLVCAAAASPASPATRSSGQLPHPKYHHQPTNQPEKSLLSSAKQLFFFSLKTPELFGNIEIAWKEMPGKKTNFHVELE